MQFEIWSDEEILLAKLKADWRVTIEGDGGHCPCCGKWGKISPFTITETHAVMVKIGKLYRRISVCGYQHFKVYLIRYYFAIKHIPMPHRHLGSVVEF